jgi:hypothetical protein
MIELHYQASYTIRNPFNREVAELIARGLAEYFVQLAKTFVPVRTGRLQASIHIDRVEIFGNQARINVVASTEYAAVVEFGRRKFAPFPGRFYFRRARELLLDYVTQYIDDIIDFHSIVEWG